MPKKYLSIDIEASKLPNSDPWNIGSFLCSIGLRSSEDSWHEEYFFNHETELLRPHAELIAEIQGRIDSSDMLVFHNAKFDMNWLRHVGIKFEHKSIWCCMIAEYLLFGQNPEVELKLNTVAARYELGSKIDAMAEYWKNGFETDRIPYQLHKDYLAQDTLLTLQVFEKQLGRVKDAGLGKLAHLSFETSKVLSRMECHGIPFDKDKALEFVDQYRGKLTELDAKLLEAFGYKINFASSDQLGAALFGGSIKHEVQEIVAKQRKNGTYRVYTRKAVAMRALPGVGFVPHVSTKSKKTGKFSVGKKALAWLRWETHQQEQVLKLLTERSNAAKVYSTLISDSSDDGGLLRKIGKDGRLHPTFGQTFTSTGRLASSNPNGQNFPRTGTSPIKSLIKPSNGNVIVDCDKSQIEWRMAASLSKDKLMCDEIWHGFDVHTDRVHRSFLPEGQEIDESSKEFKKLRGTAKTFNFRMIYNGKAQSFYYDADMPRYTLEQWKQIVPDFYKKYFELRKWQEANRSVVDSLGYLRNPSGRFLTFKYWTDEDDRPDGYNFNAICNYPIQSASFDLIMLALVLIYKKMQQQGLTSNIILQVHDSLVFECPPEEVYQVGRICLDVFDDIPRLAKEYFDWDILVPIIGECKIGSSYGNMPCEFKSQQKYCTKPSDLMLTEKNVADSLTSLT